MTLEWRAKKFMSFLIFREITTIIGNMHNYVSAPQLIKKLVKLLHTFNDDHVIDDPLASLCHSGQGDHQDQEPHLG